MALGRPVLNWAPTGLAGCLAAGWPGGRALPCSWVGPLIETARLATARGGAPGCCLLPCCVRRAFIPPLSRRRLGGDTNLMHMQT